MDQQSINWYFAFCNDLIRQSSCTYTISTQQLISQSTLPFTHVSILTFLNNIHQLEKSQHLSSPIQYQYFRKTKSIQFTNLSLTSVLLPIYFTQVLHQRIIPFANTNLNFSTNDFDTFSTPPSSPYSSPSPLLSPLPSPLPLSPLPFPPPSPLPLSPPSPSPSPLSSPSSSLLPNEYLRAQLKLKLMYNKLHTEHTQLLTQYNTLQETNNTLTKQLSSKSQLIFTAAFKEFDTYLPLIGLNDKSEPIDFTTFDLRVVLTHIQTHFPNLYQLLTQFTISKGAYRNTHNTSNHKLLAALYHVSCLRYIRTQSANYLQQYFALVMRSIGQSKIALTFNQTIGNTTSYYKTKNFLDKRAANLSYIISTTFPKSVALGCIWDNWVFTSKIKHQRLNTTPTLVHSTIRAIFALPSPTTTYQLQDFIIPIQKLPQLPFTTFTLDSSDQANKSSMLAWLLSRHATTIIPNITKHKFPSKQTTKLHFTSIPMLFENETSNNGTKVILEDFAKICNISEGGDYDAYLKLLFEYLESDPLYTSNAQYIEQLAYYKQKVATAGKIQHPARLFFLGAGDCVTYLRATENAQFPNFWNGAGYPFSIFSAASENMTYPSMLITLGLFHLLWHYLKANHQIFWLYGYKSMANLVKHGWIGAAAKVFYSSNECFQMIYTAAWQSFLKALAKVYPLQVFLNLYIFYSIFCFIFYHFLSFFLVFFFLVARLK